MPPVCILYQLEGIFSHNSQVPSPAHELLLHPPGSQQLSTQCLSGELTNVVRHRVEQLGLNVALQLLVGVPLEMVHGATRIGLVYVAGVVAGRHVGPVVILPGMGQRRSHGWCKPRLPGHTQIIISGLPDSELCSWQISHSHPDREVYSGEGVELLTEFPLPNHHVLAV